MTREAVIVSGARTAIGTAYRGSLADVDALELGTKAVAEAVRRSGLDPELVDDVVMGESLYGGGDIGRYAAIEAGLVNAPGVAHNRHCASGLGRRCRARPRRSSRAWTGSWWPAASSPARPPRSRPGGYPGTDDLGRGLARAQPPRDARRPDPGHDDHRRLERRGPGRRHPGGAWTPGPALPPARRGRDRRGQLRRRDLPRSRSPAATGRGSPSPSTSTPGAARPWRSWRR